MGEEEREVMRDPWEIRQEVAARLRNVRGHLSGIERMVEEGKECPGILVQLAAVRAALEKITALVIENYAQTCYKELINRGEDPQRVVVEVVRKVLKLL
ncbi:MAG: metal-sensitive transcriptional regulator [Bacillota bacterium]|nr:metal-sensitive transcriptional regulator [Bacillota bacterium]